MPRRSLHILVVVLMALGPAQARDIYVNHEAGNDRFSGLTSTVSASDGPVRRIAVGIKRAAPGDTVHLIPTSKPYKETPVFHDRQGEAGRPITLDGHGATVSGCEPLVPEDWRMVSPGLYRHDHLMPRPDGAVIGRWFFRFGGRMNHMGRTSKGKSAALKKPEDLQAGEWTFQESDKSFYIRIDPASQLADYRIEAPVRSAGVQISGHCEHLVIRNLITTHVYNDGYNIHGTTRDVRLENIQAIECGDDGISAHDDCEIAVDGFISIGNSTGVCNTGQSASTNNRLFLRDNLGVDFYLIGSNQHTLTNSFLDCTAHRPMLITGEEQTPGICTLKMDNVVLIGRGGGNLINFSQNSVVEAKRVTAYGLGIIASGKSVSLSHCVFGGKPQPDVVIMAGTGWKAEANVYDLHYLRMDKMFYNAKNFADYVLATGQDRQSVWSSIEFKQPVDGSIQGPDLPAGVGADRSRLPRR